VTLTEHTDLCIADLREERAGGLDSAAEKVGDFVRRCHQDLEETQMSKLGDELVRFGSMK